MNADYFILVPIFFTLLSIHYRIQAVNGAAKKLQWELELNSKQKHIAHGVPEILITDQIITDQLISKNRRSNVFPPNRSGLLNYQFESTAIIFKFYWKFYAEYIELVRKLQISINGYNLKLIASSESTLESLQGAIRELYSIKIICLLNMNYWRLSMNLFLV